MIGGGAIGPGTGAGVWVAAFGVDSGFLFLIMAITPRRGAAIQTCKGRTCRHRSGRKASRSHPWRSTLNGWKNSMVAWQTVVVTGDSSGMRAFDPRSRRDGPSPAFERSSGLNRAGIQGLSLNETMVVPVFDRNTQNAMPGDTPSLSAVNVNAERGLAAREQATREAWAGRTPPLFFRRWMPTRRYANLPR